MPSLFISRSNVADLVPNFARPMLPLGQGTGLTFDYCIDVRAEWSQPIGRFVLVPWVKSQAMVVMRVNGLEVIQ